MQLINLQAWAKKCLYNRFLISAMMGGIVIAAIGIYPHVRWSIENQEISWFYNSYDEGYYGWQAMKEFSLYRLFSWLIIQPLFLIAGFNTQICMILADAVFPMAVFIAGCYMVRPLCKSAKGMIGSSLFLICFSEVFALRSNFIPHHQLYTWIEQYISAPYCIASNLWQIGNLTSTFWIFRTPEPQVSWIFLYLILGVAIRIAAWSDFRKKIVIGLIVGITMFGAGYIFCSLPLSFAFLLFGILSFKQFSNHARWIGAAGLLGLISAFAFALIVSNRIGGDSLIIKSRLPILTFSCCIGLFAAFVALIRIFSEREKSPLYFLSIALGIVPIIMSNQQLITGKMIYLLNFENFGFSPLIGAACLIAFRFNFVKSFKILNERIHISIALLTYISIIIFFCYVLINSQVMSFNQYLNQNKDAQDIAQIIKNINPRSSKILCEDLFSVDILPIILGYRPNFLLSRNMIFNHPIKPLVSAKKLTCDSENYRKRLYHLLDLRRVTPEQLDEMLKGLANKESQPLDWKDRFLLGSFLYNANDWWIPITHGRNTRLDDIYKQRDLIIEEYKDYLKKTEPASILYISRVNNEKLISLSGREYQKTYRNKRFSCFEQENNHQ